MTEELLERVRREIRERKQAAQAAVDESLLLERVLVALGPQPSAGSRPAPSGSGRPRRSSGRRRRAAPGANRDAILALVRERPGVSAGEIAQATGIARSTVAPTLSRLTAAGAIERSDQPGGRLGFRPAREPAVGAETSEQRVADEPVPIEPGQRSSRGTDSPPSWWGGQSPSARTTDP